MAKHPEACQGTGAAWDSTVVMLLSQKYKIEPLQEEARHFILTVSPKRVLLQPECSVKKTRRLAPLAEYPAQAWPSCASWSLRVVASL